MHNLNRADAPVLRARYVLENARELLQTGGWFAELHEGASDGSWIYGPEGGPYRLRQAIWRGACYVGPEGQACHDMQAMGIAQRWVEAVFKGERVDWVAIGRWERAEGRTQSDIERALTLALRVQATRLLDFIREAGEPEKETSNG